MSSNYHAIPKEAYRELQDALMTKRLELAKLKKQVADEMGLGILEWCDPIQPHPRISALEKQIKSLEDRLAAAQVQERPTCTDTIDVGAKVVFRLGEGKTVTVEIGAYIPGAKVQHISPLSPLGRALVGAKVGETVVYTAPTGQLSATVISITY